MKRLALVVLLVVGCRTEITPVLVKAAPVRQYKMVEGECEVHEYPRGDEVPSGASNIGWLTVDRQATDEATFEQLRLAVCAKGGNAFSQARWLRNTSMSVGDPPVGLEANAWLLSEPR